MLATRALRFAGVARRAYALASEDRTMKKILRVLAALAGLVVLFVLVVLLVGWRQPVDHVASSRAALAAAPEAVWARIVDFERWPEWNSAFTRVVREEDRGGKAYWRFEGGFGPMPMLIEVLEPPQRLVTRIPEDADIGFSGTWTYTLAPRDGGGTTVTVTEEGHVESLLFRGVGALFMDQHTTMNEFLTALAKGFGETVTPEQLP